MIVSLILVIISLTLFVFWWELSNQCYWAKRGVSYIRCFPIIGAFGKSIILRKNFSIIFSELYNDKKTKNDPISGFFFFKKPCLIVRDIELIKMILVKDFNCFPSRLMPLHPKVDPVAVNFIPIATGETWRNMRRLITKVFNTSRMNKYFPLVQEVCDTLEEKLSREIPPQCSKEYDLVELSTLYAIDTVSSCAFGIHTKCLNNLNKTLVRMINSIVSFNLWRYFKFFLNFLAPTISRALRITLSADAATKFLRKLYRHVMSEREIEKISGVKKDDFLDICLEVKDIFSEDALLAQFGTLYLSGGKGASNLMAFALYELAKNPELQERLRRSIPQGELGQKDIADLKLLDMIFKETLRFYPEMLFIDRGFNPEDESESYSLEPFSKFSIPRGMPLFIPIHGIHRDPKYYSEPDEYNPENFNSQEGVLLTFGQGPKSCPGRLFGELQFKLGLIAILRRFRVHKCHKTPEVIIMSNEPGFLKPKDPIVLNLKRIY